MGQDERERVEWEIVKGKGMRKGKRVGAEVGGMPFRHEGKGKGEIDEQKACGRVVDGEERRMGE